MWTQVNYGAEKASSEALCWDGEGAVSCHAAAQPVAAIQCQRLPTTCCVGSGSCSSRRCIARLLTVCIVRLAAVLFLRAELLARRTPGFSGAELANLVNESALLAARYDRDAISLNVGTARSVQAELAQRCGDCCWCG